MTISQFAFIPEEVSFINESAIIVVMLHVQELGF